ncbi:MAG: hypothetical protein SOZ47_05315 [Lawsonibacter sp.]|nr:hypothetical protein [Lawsonibacter sp.]
MAVSYTSKADYRNIWQTYKGNKQNGHIRCLSRLRSSLESLSKLKDGFPIKESRLFSLILAREKPPAIANGLSFERRKSMSYHFRG